jgi:multiple sugar transport system substrate-binding protein
MSSHLSNLKLDRRQFFGVAGALAGVGLLASCSTGTATDSGGGGSSRTPLKFWNMPWGKPAFNDVDEKITKAYKPQNGLPAATYQTIQWSNYIQVFSSAIASGTGPAVSSGGSTQAFLFESQGKIAYADDLIESWKSNGIYDDFLPGLTDALKVKNGYVAVPYNVDCGVLWYNPDLLDKAGADVPKDWQSYLDTCAALKKIGVYGYGTGAGSGNLTGANMIWSILISNGGGFFDEHQKVDAVTPRNIEAVDFVLELAAKGYIDPASTTYTSANVFSQWEAGKFGMGFANTGFAKNLSGPVASTVKVGSPLTTASGSRGTSRGVNNIMMYKNTPSQKGSEAFLTYYYQHMAPLWTQGTGIGIPALRSITKTKEFRANANDVKIVEEWIPIGRSSGSPGSKSAFLGVSAIDSTPALQAFAQSILGGSTTAKEALQTLQKAATSA